MITQSEIAATAKVSRSLVSQVLAGKSGLRVKDETRQRVMKACRDLGYVVKKKESSVSHQTIAVSLSEGVLGCFANPFFAEILRGVSSVAQEKDYHILLCDHPEGNACELPRAVLQRRAEGVLHLGPIASELLSELEKIREPVCVAGDMAGGDWADYVCVNSRKVGYTAIEFLYKKGHRKIAYFSSPFHGEMTQHAGILGAMENMELDSSFVFPFPEKCGMEIDRRAGRLLAEEFLAKELMEKEGITAIMCTNDAMAMGVYEIFLQKRIHIGQDVSIMGTGDIIGDEDMLPPLTTISIPKFEIGRLACQRIIERIRVPEQIRQEITLPVSVVERGSVCDIN